jgi:hypothetical protein
MQEIAAVLVRSLAVVVQSMLETLIMRDCVRRERTFRLRLGKWLEVETSKAEEFDRTR